MNETLWLTFAILDLAVVVAVFRCFGRAGLFAMIAVSLVLCNIQVIKTVELFGVTTTLGNVIYASVFLSTDMLSEFYGKEEARRGVLLGFAALVAAAVYMQIALLFSPAESDFAQPHLQAIFGYLVSQLHDVWAFHLIREKTGGRKLWLRNNLSTLASQALDSLVFCLIAFLGVFETGVFLQILASTYLIKVVMAVLDTPFIYLAKRLAPDEALARSV
jgi:uncharacterized integral membrane protein (TIGR00697 family)